jgi:2-phosphosulfolactate phosphatase
MTYDQDGIDIHCEWGPSGLRELTPWSDVIVIVDVLSFSTCVDIATARGATVYPWRWHDYSSVEFAHSIGGALAGRRGQARYSLSPTSLLRIEAGTRLVLPSPNGSTLSADAGDAATFAGCLRNAAAVAAAARTCGRCIAVIAAGERWPDGTLRPALEDWLGAGAIIEHLPGSLSPEAAAARAAFRAAEPPLFELLARTRSGQELIERRFGRDVELASALQVSRTAPRLIGRAYVDSARDVATEAMP